MNAQTTLNERIHHLLTRRPFAVLGYSAERETYCPQCLRLATGLSPHGVDTDGKPVLPLHLAEPLFHDETCCNCHAPLLSLIPSLDPSVHFALQSEHRVPDTKIVQRQTIGNVVLHADGRGTLTTDSDGETYFIFPENTVPTVETRHVAPKPPTIRRRSRALAAA